MNISKNKLKKYIYHMTQDIYLKGFKTKWYKITYT